uniref:DUF6598 domain-containing protein n=1 Tax=Setaria viridis TaxID=4556 RepID=A0A4U6TTI6_SETVI|nr:hypothetical protein SEVIR_7G136500v2 [Setaria viridis]
MQNPYLVLRGSVRGVMFGDLVVFEVLLYVRGTTESDDRELSQLAPWFSTLDFKLGYIVSSMEATISVQVIFGLSPDGFYGRFTATSAGIDEEFVLLDSKDEKVSISGESYKRLRISVKAWQGGSLLGWNGFHTNGKGNKLPNT